MPLQITSRYVPGFRIRPGTTATPRVGNDDRSGGVERDVYFVRRGGAKDVASAGSVLKEREIQ